MIGEQEKQALLASCPNRSLEEIARQRAREVGTIPRRVFSNPMAYESFKKRLEGAMKHDEEEIISVLRWPVFGKPLSAVFAIDAATDAETQEPIYTSREVRFVSDYARARASLNMVQALHDILVKSDVFSPVGMEYEKLVTLMIIQHGFQGKMEELGVPNPKTVELTIEPGGAWLQAGTDSRDKFFAAVKSLTVGSPVIAGNNVPAIDLAAPTVDFMCRWPRRNK